jgi:acyl-CoA thioesterase
LQSASDSRARTEGGSDLEEATRVEGDAGCYHTRLSKDWEIWGPNGGYLAAIALRAASMHADIRQPASLYCHFLRSPAFDAVQLDVTVLQRGRRTESFAVAMTQRGKPVLHALVKTAARGPGYGRHQLLDPPEVPPPADLKSAEQLGLRRGRPHFAFWNNVERRPVDQRTSKEPTAPVIREWTRFRPRPRFEDPFVDAARALILLDTYGFPAAYQMYRSSEYLAPNLDTSAWFHHLSPSCEWLLIDHECILAECGLMAVSGRVWDTDGRLVATGSSQLYCVPSRR